MYCSFCIPSQKYQGTAYHIKVPKGCEIVVSHMYASIWSGISASLTKSVKADHCRFLTCVRCIGNLHQAGCRSPPHFHLAMEAVKCKSDSEDRDADWEARKISNKLSNSVSGWAAGEASIRNICSVLAES